jgi:hypothetical protein
MIGRLYYAAKQWNDAAQSFKLAIEKRPNHFLSHYLFGKSILELSKSEKKNFYSYSESSLRQARELTTNKRIVDVVLAEVLFIEAKLFYQRAMLDTTADVAMLCDSALTFCKKF